MGKGEGQEGVREKRMELRCCADFAAQLNKKHCFCLCVSAASTYSSSMATAPLPCPPPGPCSDNRRAFISVILSRAMSSSRG